MMLAVFGGALAKYFGPRAFKAVASAVAGGAGAVATTAVSACDIEGALLPYIGTAGVAAVSYLLTYIVPNREDKK